MSRRAAIGRHASCAGSCPTPKSQSRCCVRPEFGNSSKGGNGFGSGAERVLGFNHALFRGNQGLKKRRMSLRSAHDNPAFAATAAGLRTSAFKDRAADDALGGRRRLRGCGNLGRTGRWALGVFRRKKRRTYRGIEGHGVPTGWRHRDQRRCGAFRPPTGAAQICCASMAAERDPGLPARDLGVCL